MRLGYGVKVLWGPINYRVFNHSNSFKASLHFQISYSIIRPTRSRGDNQSAHLSPSWSQDDIFFRLLVSVEREKDRGKGGWRGRSKKETEEERK